jgi:hypothetical protein
MPEEKHNRARPNTGASAQCGDGTPAGVDTHRRNSGTAASSGLTLRATETTHGCIVHAVSNVSRSTVDTLSKATGLPSATAPHDATPHRTTPHRRVSLETASRHDSFTKRSSCEKKSHAARAPAGDHPERQPTGSASRKSRGASYLPDDCVTFTPLMVSRRSPGSSDMPGLPTAEITAPYWYGCSSSSLRSSGVNTPSGCRAGDGGYGRPRNARKHAGGEWRGTSMTDTIRGATAKHATTLLQCTRRSVLVPLATAGGRWTPAQ